MVNIRHDTTERIDNLKILISEDDVIYFSDCSKKTLMKNSQTGAT